MDNLIQDIRLSLRMLSRAPGLTAIIVFTLALGIGANTAIFSIVDGILFKSLPYSDPEQLVFIWGEHAGQGKDIQQVSYLDFADIRNRNEVFENVAAMFIESWTLTGQPEAEQVRGLRASPGIFSLLGVEAVIGRTFLPEEEQPGKDRVVVLSYRLWQNRFGGEFDLLGKAITISGESYTVIGVLPQGFDLEFPLTQTFSIADNDVWMPLTSSHPRAGNRAIFTYEVIARLKKGTSIEQAAANLATLGDQLRVAYPDTNRNRSFNPVLAHEYMVGNVRPVLLMLFASVGLVLTVACANIANLLLGRASGRRKEIAIRTALGASRWRIARQLLTESLMLALSGGFAGLILALWSVDLLVNLPGVSLPRVEEINIDGRVLAFTIALSILTGVIFGLVPALTASSNLHNALKETGAKITGGSHQRLRYLLIVSEISLTFVLLVGAGLLTKSFLSLLKVNPGFDTANTLKFAVSPPATKYTNLQQIASFYRELVPRLETLPQVSAVGVVSSLPLSGHNSGSAARVEGRVMAPNEQPAGIGWQTIMPKYFQAIGIPLLEGRDFTETDLTRPQHLTIINQSLAAILFPGEEALGRRVSFNAPGTEPDWHEIIGVVGDVRHTGLEAQPQPRAYDLFGQHGSRSMTVVIRSGADPTQMVGAIRAQVNEIERDAPVYSIATLEELLSLSTSSRRFSLLLVVGFALLALMLAAIGIYGVLSYYVNQRTREIGIRIALGASRADVIKLVMGQCLWLTIAGLGTGLVASLALTRLISSLLFGVSPTDTSTFVIISLLLTIVALAACYVPVQRATRVDPMEALRYE